MNRNTIYHICAIFFGLIMVDYLTKLWAHSTLLESQNTINIIGDLLSFRFVWNPNSAFGILKLNTLGFILVNIIITTVLIAITYKKKLLIEWLPVIAIIAGGWGNIIDRLIYGQVVDFISTMNGSFPVFNMADVFVVVGVFWLVGANWKNANKSK